MLKYCPKKTIYICLAVLLAVLLFQWHAEAQYDFKIINASATTDKNNYNRTELIKINYSLFCQGKGENQKMQLKLNKSFDFSQQLPPFYKKSPGQQCSKLAVIDPDKKTLEAKLCNGPNKPTIAVILCNITSSANCPVSVFNLTSDKFLSLYDRGDNNELRIPANITINDNPPIISNFRGNTSSANCGDIIKFDFNLSDKDSENISYALFLNKSNSIIDIINNSTRTQFALMKPISLNYNSSRMTQEDYYFRIFAQSNEGGYSWSTPWIVTILDPKNDDNLKDYLKFAFVILIFIITAIFYLISVQEEPLTGASTSIIISFTIIIIYYYFVETDFILLLVLYISALIATNYGLSALEKEITSNTHSRTNESCPTPAIAIRVVSLFTQAFANLWTSIKIILQGNIPQMNRTKDTYDDKILVDGKIKRDMNWARAISSIWIFIIMAITILSSSEVYVQSEFDLSVLGTIILPLIFALAVFYTIRKCPDMYAALAFILCVIWLGVLGHFFSNLYVRNFVDRDYATYVIIHVLASLGFLPFITFFYYKVRYKSYKKK